MNRDNFSAGRGIFDLVAGLIIGWFICNIVIPDKLIGDFPKERGVAAFSLVCLGIDFLISSRKPKQREQEFQTSLKLLEKNKKKQIHIDERSQLKKNKKK